MKRILLTFISATLFAASLFAQHNTGRFNYVTLTPDDGFPSTINSIYIEDYNCAALCSDNGLYIIDNGKAERLSMNSAYPNTMAGDFIFDCLRDNAGNRWVLTNGGITGCDPRQPMTGVQPKTGIPSDAIAYCALAMDSVIYFGGINTIWKYTYSSGSFELVTTFQTPKPFHISKMVPGGGRIMLFTSGNQSMHFFYPETGIVQENPGLDQDNVTAVLQTKEGQLWVAHSGRGIRQLEDGGKAVATYNTGNGLSSNHVTCAIEINGMIWVGTNGGGINIIDPRQHKVVQILCNTPTSSNPLPDNHISDMKCDLAGNIWCATSHNGAFVIVEEGFIPFDLSLIGPDISPGGENVLYHDKDNDIFWAGFKGNGIMMFSKDGEIRRFPQTDGMDVTSIARYNDKELVISVSPEGLYRVDKTSGRLTKITRNDSIADVLMFGDVGTFLCNDADNNIIAIRGYVSRKNSSTGQVERWPLPEESNGRIFEVSRSNATYFYDRRSLFRWDENAENKLVRISRLVTPDFISTACMGKDDIIWLGCKDGILRYSISENKVRHIALNIDSRPQTILYDPKRNCLWIGTSRHLYCYNENGNLAIIDKSMGVPDNMYSARAQLIDNQGNIVLSGQKYAITIRNDFKFDNRLKPSLEVDAVAINGNALDHFEKLTVHPNVMSLDIAFNIISASPLKQKRFHFILDGPQPIGRTEYFKDEPIFHFKSNLLAGQYTIYGSCSANDGSWTPMTMLYSFKVRKHWYATWWFTLFVVICIGFAVYRIARLRNRKKIIKERLKAERAQAANEMKTRFVQNTSHDIRTPLNAIVGYSQILGMPDGTLSAAQKEEYSGYIVNSAELLCMLVDDILNLSDIENDVYKIEKKVTPCNRICFKSVRCAELRVPAGVNMTWTSDVDDDYMIFSDPKRIEQILINFLTNACKHTVQGAIIVNCSVKEDPGKVVFSVTDTGEGIPENLRKNIFERYKSLDNCEGGHGLGLNICSSLAEKIGGYVSLDQEYTDGARFLLTIPNQRNFMTKFKKEDMDSSLKPDEQLTGSWSIVSEQFFKKGANAPVDERRIHLITKLTILDNQTFNISGKDKGTLFERSYSGVYEYHFNQDIVLKLMDGEQERGQACVSLYYVDERSLILKLDREYCNNSFNMEQIDKLPDFDYELIRLKRL